jgi:hypothetical protein
MGLTSMPQAPHTVHTYGNESYQVGGGFLDTDGALAFREPASAIR